MLRHCALERLIHGKGPQVSKVLVHINRTGIQLRSLQITVLYVQGYTQNTLIRDLTTMVLTRAEYQ
jgi:hypothetical protein